MINQQQKPYSYWLGNCYYRKHLKQGSSELIAELQITFSNYLPLAAVILIHDIALIRKDGWLLIKCQQEGSGTHNY